MNNIRKTKWKIKNYIGITIIEGIPNLLFRVYSFILYPGLERIYVIGDSHTGTFRFNHHFIVHHIGPVTAFNLINKKSTTDSRQKLFKIINRLKRNSKVILVAGEIDCRIHIYNRYMKNNCKDSIEDLILQTISRFINAVKEIINMNMEVYICSITPANSQKNYYKYPYYGSIQDQMIIKKQFNLLLSKICFDNNIKYIDMYSNIVDSNGFIKKEYTDDEIHCNRKAVIFAENYFKLRKE